MSSAWCRIGITTIEEVNEFLNSYIKEFNEKFALPLHNIKSVFETQPLNEKINVTLILGHFQKRLTQIHR
ncbi:MAG: hypothetical protein RSA77_02045 [Clostridium sp.]